MFGISIGVYTPRVLDRETQPSAVGMSDGVLWRDPAHQKNCGLCQRKRGRLNIQIV